MVTLGAFSVVDIEVRARFGRDGSPPEVVIEQVEDLFPMGEREL